jgi:hypothetical protein
MPKSDVNSAVVKNMHVSGGAAERRRDARESDSAQYGGEEVGIMVD